MFQLKPLKIEDFGKLAGSKKCAHVGITGLYYSILTLTQ